VSKLFWGQTTEQFLLFIL